ncbi:uncharacterized protein LOC133799483 [Humulus lupulus]|uniref:uncharacterized protein LOC133799483 n=1 Tax=Humulus lupulus TaxID=3486 RepID=UPI002B4162C8|nr:uncharacterized protein LOC133799483 [Humulus lupulus]
MDQIATSLRQSEPQNQGKLPSQPVRNPRENSNAITLRDGKTYDPPTIPSSLNDVPLPPIQSAQQDKDGTPTTTPKPKLNIPTYVTTPPFPSRMIKTKKDEVEQEILETFRKIEVNIPLLDFIKQVPRYAKILKELCTNKRKLKGNEKNRVIIQLADRSNAYPRGVVEDVFVKVNELVFPADFYILYMEDDSVPCSTPVLLGMPFLKIARTKIDANESTLVMEFDGEVIHFNNFEAVRYPSDVHSVSLIDILDTLSQRILDLHGEDGLDVVLRETIDLKKEDVNTEVKEMVAALNSGGKVSKEVPFLELPISHEQLQPSVKSPPKLELKPLLKHLKYVYLDSKWVSPVQVIPKKSSITVVKNVEDELVPTRVQTGYNQVVISSNAV